MLEEFKDIYDIHDWARYITWLGLLVAVVFLLWASGGFPPQAWLLFFQLLMLSPGLWSVQGPALLMPLLALLFLSLFWLVGWGLLIWACMSLIRHHRKQILDRVQRSGRQWLPSLVHRLRAQVEHLRMNSLRRARMGLLRRAGMKPRPYHTPTQFAGGRMVEADWLITVPKLRLPQRQPQMQSVTLSSLATVAVGTVPDLPIRPPGSTAYTAGPTLFIAEPGRSTLLEVGIGWNVGIKRQRAPNEDSVMVLQNICTHHGQLIPFSLLVVADGIGGFEGGVEASRIAMHNMMHTVLQNIMLSDELSDEFFTDMLVGGVDWANRAIYQRGRERGKEMGTTLTAALVIGMKAYVVNVGDSRTYLYRKDAGLRQITHDHSIVATLVALGKITPDQVYTHPERNKVYRCVGCDENVNVDCFAVDLRQDDRLLLCSDGLWEMVRDPAIAHILHYYQDASTASDALVEAALYGGGADNVSVIVARVL
jgi:serine/threonine protein phosphatase PrpC